MIRFRSYQRTVTGSIIVGVYNDIQRKKCTAHAPPFFVYFYPFFVVFAVISRNNHIFVFLTSFLLGLYPQNPREKGGAYLSDCSFPGIVLLTAKGLSKSPNFRFGRHVVSKKEEWRLFRILLQKHGFYS